MQLTWPPSDGQVDPIASHVDLPGGRPHRGAWVISNMVSSLDGGVTIDGRSGALGGPGDRALFIAVRALAGTILVGAGTVRAERYRPTATTYVATAGRPHPPRLAIVSGRLDLEPALPCLSPDLPPEERPIIFTVTGAPADRRSRLAEVATVVDVGHDRLDIAELARMLSGVVVCEGGPTLLGQMVAAGLVDEWFVTIAGVATAGGAARLAHGPQAIAERLDPVSIAVDGADVFLHHVRHRTPGSLDAHD